jgi:hypothetical protein
VGALVKMFMPERHDKDNIMWKTQYDLQIYIWYKFALTVCVEMKKGQNQ